MRVHVCVSGCVFSLSQEGALSTCLVQHSVLAMSRWAPISHSVSSGIGTPRQGVMYRSLGPTPYLLHLNLWGSYFNKHHRHFRRRGSLGKLLQGRVWNPAPASGTLGPGGMGGGSWGSLWLTVSPPDLQGQQPVVVGDSVLSSREEARIESRVIFVPVETQRSVAGSVVPSRKDPGRLGP